MATTRYANGWSPCEHSDKCIGWCPACLAKYGMPSQEELDRLNGKFVCIRLGCGQKTLSTIGGGYCTWTCYLEANGKR
jgi:endo-1,4-beta-mannosidase